MTTDDKDIVAALRSELVEHIGSDRYELWFGKGTTFVLDNTTLSIGAPNRFFRDWLASHFKSTLESIIRRVAPSNLKVRFSVCSAVPVEQAEETNQENVSAVPANVESGPALNDQPLFPFSSTGSIIRKDKPEGRLKKPAGLKHFVTGLSNRIARASAETVIARPGHFSPLFIYGETGVGKTHLLQAIGGGWRTAHPNSRSVYLTAEQFTTSYVEALRGNGLPSFRQKYRGVRLLILDDLQFFLGKRHTMIELLHTIDTLLRDGQQIVLASDRSLDGLGGLGADLVSRIKSGLACEIGLPEHATRLGILRQLVDHLQLEIPDDVLHYIASNLTAHARELSGAIYRLQATSEALGEPITLEMARTALADLVRHSIRMVRLPDIQSAVCDLFGIEPSSLHSKRTAKAISQPRMLAMWLARKYTRAGLSEIGKFFGRRSHSTVLSAQRRVDFWLAEGLDLLLAENVVPIDDAIRRVEKTLLAG